MESPKSRVRRIALSAAVILGLGLVLVPVSLAGKGGHGGGSTTRPAQAPSASTCWTPPTARRTWMQKVTFDVYTTATPFSMGHGGLLRRERRLVCPLRTASSPRPCSRSSRSGSNTWMSGDADCTALLQNWDNYAKHGSITNLGSTSFHVYA